MLKRAAVLLTIGAWCLGAQAGTELKIVTTDGFVAFTVPDHWPVISMATKPPIMAAVFQIPNPADEGTPDSTNLTIRFFDLEAQAGRDEFLRVGAPIDGASPSSEVVDGWTVYLQRASQGETEYSIMDANRDLETLSVAVRLAWPHLKGNSKSYRDEIRQTFQSVLQSIYQQIGSYDPEESDVIRRSSP